MDRRSWFASVVAFLTSLLGWKRAEPVLVLPDLVGKNHGVLCGFGKATLLVGRQTSPHFHSGIIAEYRVYDRVLTDSEVEAIAADADAGYPETLNRIGKHS